jgi:hypothetical protein
VRGHRKRTLESGTNITGLKGPLQLMHLAGRVFRPDSDSGPGASGRGSCTAGPRRRSRARYRDGGDYSYLPELRLTVAYAR